MKLTGRRRDFMNIAVAAPGATAPANLILYSTFPIDYSFMSVKMNLRWSACLAGILLPVMLSLKSNARSGWNLKLGAQPGFTQADAEKLLAPVYDTVDVLYPSENDELKDTVELTFAPLYFFEAEGTVYALQAVENRGPAYGVSTGWCDLFLFKKAEGHWQLNDIMRHAGGGGMYGNPGQFEGMLKTGANAAGIILSGGQTHMGELFHDDIILVKEGKLSPMLRIYTHHSYGDWDEDKDAYRICEDNTYEFLQSDKERYDLRIIRSNCLDKQMREEERVTLPYEKGYAIPPAFMFES